ncbi:hypothetical protein BASA81_003049 [Batrachochytrium salamandrivorans]|nr:hypothetical protein BASA81_003049 [Batrachochytrium salamandrivorans]
MEEEDEMDLFASTNVANLQSPVLCQGAATNLANLAMDFPRQVFAVPGLIHQVLLCMLVHAPPPTTTHHALSAKAELVLADLLCVLSSVTLPTVQVPEFMTKHGEYGLEVVIRLAKLGRQSPLVSGEAMTVLFNLSRCRDPETIVRLRANVELVQLLQREKLCGQLIAVMSLANLAGEELERRSWRLCSAASLNELFDLLRYVVTSQGEESGWELNEPLLALRYIIQDNQVRGEEDLELLVWALAKALESRDEYCIELSLWALQSQVNSPSWTAKAKQQVCNLYRPPHDLDQFQLLILNLVAKLPPVLTLLSVGSVPRRTFSQHCAIKRLPREMLRLVFQTL